MFDFCSARALSRHILSRIFFDFQMKILSADEMVKRSADFFPVDPKKLPRADCGKPRDEGPNMAAGRDLYFRDA
jgi:hypothetical protein